MCKQCDNADKLAVENGHYKCPCGMFICSTGYSISVGAEVYGALIGARCPGCSMEYHVHTLPQYECKTGDPVVAYIAD